MKDSTRRKIATGTWVVICFYMVLALVLYGFPIMGAEYIPALVALGEASFFLIPVAVILVLASLLAPFAAILFIGALIDMAMCKLLRVDFDS